MIKIVLDKAARGYQWLQLDNVYVRGYVIIRGKVLRNHDFANFIITNIVSFKSGEFLKNIIGQFSIIIKYERSIYLITDKIRSFPLFFSKCKTGALYVSDNAYTIRDMIGVSLNKNSLSQLDLMPFVLGDKTIFNEIRNVPSCTICKIDDGNLTFDRYYTFLVEANEVSENENFEKLSATMLEVFSDLMNVIQGRQVVIPLSGGFDSRIIVTMLKHFNVEDVICFSYGNRDSSEAVISKMVAEQLGIEWHFVEYNEDLIDLYGISNNSFADFIRYSSCGVSVAVTQDYFALKKLLSEGIIKKDSVVIPGHSGDFLGGSHLRKSPWSPEDRLNKKIFSKHCYAEPLSQNEINFGCGEVFSRIENELGYFAEHSIDDNFNYMERQAKFIVNSCRTYLYLGLEYALPLWDSRMIEVCRKVPLSEKLDSKLYEKVLLNFFENYGVTKKRGDRAMRPNYFRRNFKNLLHKFRLYKLVAIAMDNFRVDNNSAYLRAKMFGEKDVRNIDRTIARWQEKNLY